jgi:hypothetical protein
MVYYRPVIIGMVVTLILGLISVFTTFLGFFTQIVLGISATVIGGLVAAYTTDGGNKDGGVNGAMAGGFGGALLGVILFSSTFDSVFYTFAGIFTGLLVGFLIGMNFGIIGAVIGNIIKKSPQAIPKKDNGYLVCNKCGGYYELQEGENPEDFDLICECGGKLQYKKSIKQDIRFNFDRVFGVGVLLSIIGGILLICTFWGWDISKFGRRVALYSFMSGIMIILLYYFKSKGIDW